VDPGRSRPSNNSIGGTEVGEGNTIAHNGFDGILLSSAAGTGNRVLGNAVHSNAGLGIDLGGDGVTANNGTKNAGLPNSDMDSPVFTSATLSGTTLTVAGYVAARRARPRSPGRASRSSSPMMTRAATGGRELPGVPHRRRQWQLRRGLDVSGKGL